MPFFERYLSVWVGLAIIAGVGLGQAAPPPFLPVAAFPELAALAPELLADE